MVDLMGMPDLAVRAPFLQALGCHYLCIHLAHDLQVAQGALTVEYLQQLRQQLPDVPLAIAGGINPAILDSVLRLTPAIVIVGSAITAANDPVAVACAMHERIASYDNSI
jgi:3-hexulose-6-phosphate synthase